MNATDVIGWTADADYWCTECATLTFDRMVDGVLRTVQDDREQFHALDSEGNPVTPIFASDETPAGTICTLCKDEITEPADPDIWALLEQDAPAGCAAVQDLYSWSLNFDSGTGPFALILDLIGWSEDELGDDVYRKGAGLGYVELSKLASALQEYADRPHDVREYVDTLMSAESR